jgi:tetratricopeptide (TPR) repeat protein
MRIGLIAIMALALGGFASAVPLSDPPMLMITPPAADLPPEVAAFSGIWEGVWDGGLLSRFAVEELAWDAAVVVYAWADQPGWFQGGWSRDRAKVLPGGTLEWSNPQGTVTFIFTLAEDQRHLRGERVDDAGLLSLVTMQKVSPAPPPADRPFLAPLVRPTIPPEEPLARLPAVEQLSPLARAQLLDAEARRLGQVGRYQEAIPLAEDALRWREITLAPTHPAVATSLNNLAWLYQAQGRYAEAAPLYQRALTIRELALGPTHPHVATSLNNLAWLYFDQGRYAEAEPLDQRALAIREQALEPTHPDMAQSLHNLAMVYFDQGRYAEAEPLFQRALAIGEQALGLAHPNMVISLNNLAELYQAQGRYAEAEPLYQWVLAIGEQALGLHPYVAISLNNLAGLYRDQGWYAEAEPLYQRALAIREQALGPTHPYVARSLHDLAGLYDAQGQWVQAESLYRRALAIRESVLGPTHPDVARSLGNLASGLARQHQSAQARPLFERARQISLAVSRANVDLKEEAARGLLRQHTEILRAYAALLATTARESGRDPTLPATTFVVAEQARGGAVQLALARAGAWAAATNPATAALARQVEELRQRQRAIWRQLSDDYSSSGVGSDARRRASLQQAL